MATILSLAWRRYLRRLKDKPLSTKAITAGCLAGLSDVLAQRLTAPTKSLDLRRTCAWTLFGALYSGPSMHYWQNMMEYVFRKRRPSPALVAFKVAIDQLTYGPCCNALALAYFARAVEGRSWAGTRAKLERDYVPVQLAAWRLWPLVAMLNYAFVPLPLRVLFVNVVGLAWSAYLSTIAARAPALARAALKAP